MPAAYLWTLSLFLPFPFLTRALEFPVLVIGDALAAIIDARRRLRERARCIADRAWRRSFLCNVPENARTLALAQSWGREQEDTRKYSRHVALTMLGLGEPRR